MATDLNIPKDVLCPAKEEKDPTVFSVRVRKEYYFLVSSTFDFVNTMMKK